MRTTVLLITTLASSLTARADFSYTSTTKMSGGMFAGAAGANGSVSKHFLKGQKMKIDFGDNTMVLDFEAQTMTSISKSRKTYSVTNFSDIGQNMKQAGAEINVDFKQTGQRKNVNGFNATEAIMTMEIDSPQARKSGVKAQMEVDMWISADVPGASELHAFYQKNAARFPWAAMGGGSGNPSMQKAMADMQRKLAGMTGVPVLEIVRMKPLGAGNEAQNAKMDEARAKLEEMKKQGGQQAAIAEQMLARMGGGAAGGGMMFETTVESSNFSTASIPDSEFAIPAGYQLVQK